MALDYKRYKWVEYYPQFELKALFWKVHRQHLATPGTGNEINVIHCDQGGILTCCFSDEICEQNWYAINNQMLERSENFLNHTNEFLGNWVLLGHDTCHRTHGYDAEQCHQDCKKLEKSEFAKKCKNDGGLFKCCIR